MDTLINTAVQFFEKSPWPAAAVIIVFLILKFGDSFISKIASSLTLKFVKREDCHNHIDDFRKELTDKINDMSDKIEKVREEVKNDFEKVEGMFIRHLEGGIK